jgi:hypothetical protein
MGATSLVTKGILGPIEGDVIVYQVGMPLEAEGVVTNMGVTLPEEVLTDTSLPDAIMAEAEMQELEVEIQVPLLEATMELEE